MSWRTTLLTFSLTAIVLSAGAQNKYPAGYLSTKKLTKLANKGDADAAFELGLEEKDHTQSFVWYRKAAELGFHRSDAEATIGLEATEDTERLFWLNRAIKDGSSEALIYLAQFYKSHPSAPREAGAPTPFELEYQAAELGQVSAQLRVGTAYLKGAGVSKNADEAERWFVRADRTGDATVEAEIGTAYEGENDARAIEYLRKATAQPATGQYYPTSFGQQAAFHQLGEVYRDGRGVPQDASLAQLCFDAEMELKVRQSEAEAAWHAEMQASIAESQERIRASQQAFLPNLAAAVVNGLSSPPNQISVAGQQQLSAISEIAARSKSEQAQEALRQSSLRQSANQKPQPSSATCDDARDHLPPGSTRSAYQGCIPYTGTQSSPATLNTANSSTKQIAQVSPPVAPQAGSPVQAPEAKPKQLATASCRNMLYSVEMTSQWTDTKKTEVVGFIDNNSIGTANCVWAFHKNGQWTDYGSMNIASGKKHVGGEFGGIWSTDTDSYDIKYACFEGPDAVDAEGLSCIAQVKFVGQTKAGTDR